jgi:hypothetical protein
LIAFCGIVPEPYNVVDDKVMNFKIDFNMLSRTTRLTSTSFINKGKGKAVEAFKEKMRPPYV